MDQYQWKKEHAYMLDLLSGYDKQAIKEFLTHSELHLSVFDVFVPSRVTRRTLEISVDPYIYRKYHNLVSYFKQEIGSLFSEVTQVKLYEVKAAPDLDKFQILQNEIVTVITPWEEINKSQGELLKLLRSASTTLDYQNVGNSSRMIMQRLSEIVFDPSRHMAPKEIDLSESKFKNRLHTYIKTELGNSQQEELRKYIESIITATEKGIDLMNKVTHDLKTNFFYSESCVISVITSIGLIKLVHNFSKAE